MNPFKNSMTKAIFSFMNNQYSNKSDRLLVKKWVKPSILAFQMHKKERS